MYGQRFMACRCECWSWSVSAGQRRSESTVERPSPSAPAAPIAAPPLLQGASIRSAPTTHNQTHWLRLLRFNFTMIFWSHIINLKCKARFDSFSTRWYFQWVWGKCGLWIDCKTQLLSIIWLILTKQQHKTKNHSIWLDNGVDDSKQG